MTDKQIIETLENIKHFCNVTDHQSCRFNYENGCQLIDIVRVLGLSTPNSWNLEEIERIINETD
jgi:hypothetical protein